MLRQQNERRVQSMCRSLTLVTLRVGELDARLMKRCSCLSPPLVMKKRQDEMVVAFSHAKLRCSDKSHTNATGCIGFETIVSVHGSTYDCMCRLEILALPRCDSDSHNSQRSSGNCRGNSRSGTNQRTDLLENGPVTYHESSMFCRL